MLLPKYRIPVLNKLLYIIFLIVNKICLIIVINIILKVLLVVWFADVHCFLGPSLSTCIYVCHQEVWEYLCVHITY